jgi:ubiquitin-conjugating enzyme E2 S
MRLMKEIGRLQTSPPEGIRVQADEDNMMDLIGMIAGPGEPSYSACV